MRTRYVSTSTASSVCFACSSTAPSTAHCVVRSPCCGRLLSAAGLCLQLCSRQMAHKRSPLASESASSVLRTRMYVLRRWRRVRLSCSRGPVIHCAAAAARASHGGACFESLLAFVRRWSKNEIRLQRRDAHIRAASESTRATMARPPVRLSRLRSRICTARPFRR